MNGRIASGPYVNFDIGRMLRWSSGAEISFRSVELGFNPEGDPALILERAGSPESIEAVCERATEVLTGGGKETEQLLYLIVPEGEDRVCKVGIAQRPRERLYTLQVASWKPLRIAGLFCPIKGQTANLEAAVHRRARKRGLVLSGEWLKLTPLEATELVMESANRCGIRVCGPDVWTDNLARRIKGLRAQQLEHRRKIEEFNSLQKSIAA